MGLTLPWQAFHGFDVGVVFCALIDVGVAILATGTQISRNPATRTSISRNAGHRNAKPRESRHANDNPEERRHVNAKPKERDTWTLAAPVVRECQKQDLHPQVLGLTRFYAGV